LAAKHKYIDRQIFIGVIEIINDNTPKFDYNY